MTTSYIYVFAFFLSKFTSWLVYNTCWWYNHPIGKLTQFGGAGQQDGRSLVFGYMKKWGWLWCAVLGGSAAEWDTSPDGQLLRLLCTIQCGILAWKGVFRFGAADQLQLHMKDRVIVTLLAALTYFHPAFVCLSLVASSILTYSISSWSIAPPYSNYLGNEFMRYSVSFAVTSLLLRSCTPLTSSDVLVMITAGQVEYYFHQGFGKVRLGNNPLDWVLQNRGECIFVNSYLRGWNRWLSRESVVWVASKLKHIRLLLGAGALLAEMGGMLSTSVAWYLLTASFHVGVFLMTGILVWENMVNHLVMCYVIYSKGDLLNVTCLTAPLIGCILISELLVVLMERLQKKDKVKGLMLFDSAYLLMCWWDSPYMRMYTYEVTTAKGVFSFPVTLFSPYDTFITDIHTRMSYFKMHTGLDRQRSADLDTVHSGVWGLLLYQEEAMKMYEMMDGKTPKTDLTLTDDADRWEVGKEDTSHPAYPFVRFFSGFNTYLKCGWYHYIMLWPHFPGEDWVPDISPVSNTLPQYTTSAGPITTVTIKLLKTFFSGTEIEVLDTGTIGVVRIPTEVSPEVLPYEDLPDYSQMFESNQRGGR
eukprot:TRINITY_DN8435_c0_g1_i1.p1 TRINITY_DN8435_c0_g1~~TRINITY_DN8435_c0_g1_i1.p1  ORF type:complete len:587 (+),score=72.33 TRINITY_DN8435_c0_g1_i1:41-1801(+)